MRGASSQPAPWALYMCACAHTNEYLFVFETKGDQQLAYL